jgi:signal transduction histidine kinase/ligand-binding sensor domain-containing protein/CheY-like chemotaxis protein/HPt (histidine-containing phosphotransfer) domain-containing protein
MRVNATSRAGAWRHRLILLLSPLFASIAFATDAPPLILAHLTAADGLPQATVMTTLQDSQGFVWLGTEDGLVRYDGHEMYRYARSRADKASLPGNFIWDIKEDAHRDLWIAVKGGGLARWNRASDTFTVFRHDPANEASLASDYVRAVLVDTDGLIWVGTSDAGVDVFDPTSGRIQRLRHTTAASSLSSDNVFSLSQGASGAIWIGTDKGLDRWSPAAKAVSRFGPAAGEDHSLVGREISGTLEERSGDVWVSTFDSGVTRFDRQGRVVRAYRHDERRVGSLKNDDVRAMVIDQTGRLWIGTTEGLDLLDRTTGQFSHYEHNGNDADSLRDSFIMSLYLDPSGLVWIGTRTGGVSRWNPRSWQLGAHRPLWLGSDPVTAFANAPDNRMWIASLGGALAQFDADKGEMTPLDALTREPRALGKDAIVMSLAQDRQGSLWIGTMANGLKKLDAAGNIQSLIVDAKNPRGTTAAGIMNVTETRAGQLWIGTFGGGANVLDPATGLVRHLPFGSKSGEISSPNVTSIVEDSNANLWIGTDGGGLNLAREDGTVTKVFSHDPKNAASFAANSVYAIAIDAKERVWVATDHGGLVQVIGSADSPDSIRFDVIGRAEGLSDTIYGIVPDVSGNIWVSTNAGLMRLDPDTRAIQAFHREDGLQGEEFASGAYIRLRDGRIAFGGPGGFNVFDPAKLTASRQPPRLAMTGISVLGVRHETGTPPWLLHSLALNYRANIVSLDFGVLDFASPQHNKLAYRVPGITDTWIDLGAQRRVTLTNLDAGDHILEVRGSASGTAWNSKPLRLTIHRQAAPWFSGWAYTAYALLAFALIFQRVRRQRLKFTEMARARDRLEHEVQLRTRELVDSNQLLEEAARAKSNFLDRMSHELRTPMNGVVGMTELLTRTALSATQTHLTKTIRSSAQILLQIVNDLLDLSKIRAGKVTLEVLPIDLGQVLEECTSLFAGSAEAKGIELIVCPPAPAGQVLLGDPLRVRQILMNLVGNAVKFTSQGEVVVRAQIEFIESHRATARISVSDTGIGLDATAMSRIFEPFSQADETTTRKFGGTGLGLSICRELADLMGGKIALESQPGIGSTFSVSLPLQVGAALEPPARSVLASQDVRILTRHASLAEALSLHASSLDMNVQTQASSAVGIVVMDVSTQLAELQSMLTGRSVPNNLVVVASAAEVEAHDLRAVIDEKRIVLKPVHRVAFQEALMAATGASTPTETVQTVSLAFQGHVLLVEDEPVNAAVAEGYLALLGCTSVWAKIGTEAIARCSTERFDMILMDLNMPDMDGFAATALIRKSEGGRRRTPIIALTAHDANSYRAKCLAADMDDILTKPYTLEDCTRLLQAWLRQPKARTSDSASAPQGIVRSELSLLDAAAVGTLQKLRAGKHADLYAKLVELYRASSADSLEKLRLAFASPDLPAAAAVCHRFAAAAANVGALEYGKQLRHLEDLCIAGDLVNAIKLYEALLEAHACLLDSLQNVSIKNVA